MRNTEHSISVGLLHDYLLKWKMPLNQFSIDRVSRQTFRVHCVVSCSSYLLVLLLEIERCRMHASVT